MLDLLLDALIDSVKLLPFLFLTYLLMEFIEDKLEDKSRAVLKKAGRLGPVWGSALGLLPQCGFSAAAASLYAGKVVTMGTLIAIYLATSDEMLPILVSESASPKLIAQILLTKFVFGLIIGFIVDIVEHAFFKIKEPDVDIHHFCEHEHCECGHGIVKPAAVHTIKIFVFILVITAVLNVIVDMVGLEALGSFILNKPVVGELLAGLIGLIPNCGASVVITSLYLQGAMNYGTMMAGLLTGAGVGVLVLFRVNEDIKQNIIITSVLYVAGVLSGILINLIL